MKTLRALQEAISKLKCLSACLPRCFLSKSQKLNIGIFRILIDKIQNRSPAFEQRERVLPPDRYLLGYRSCGGTFRMRLRFCKFLWTFLLCFFFIVVKSWDFCVPVLPMFFGLIVDREERIRSKLRRWSEVVREFDWKLGIAKERDIWICPRCFSVNVVKRDRQDLRKGKLGRLKCKDCGYVYRREKLPLPLEVPARIVNQILKLRSRGLSPSDVCEEVNEAAYDYGFRFKISRTETYNVEEKATKLISWLDRFVAVGLLEGVPCDIIEVDEIFQHKIHRRILEDFFEGEHAEGGFMGRKRNFHYIINAVSPDMKYPLPPEVAEFRNKNAFFSFALRISPYLRGDPETVRSDELRQSVSSMKLFFLSSRIESTKRTRFGKKGMGKTAHVERYNRTLRGALRKRKKIGAKRIASNLANLSRIKDIYIKPHPSLGGRRTIETLGIDWPKNIRTYSDLILFAAYVKRNAESVLDDETTIFNNPFIGRLILTLEYGPEVFENFIEYSICISPWNSFHKRVKTLKEFFERRTLRIDNRIYRGVYEAKIVDDRKAKRIHIILDLVGGVYFILSPFIYGDKPAAVCFPAVRVDPGKINHYEFKIGMTEVLGHFRLDMLLSKYISEFKKRWNLKLGENLWVARRARLDPKKPHSAFDVQIKLQRWIRYLDQHLPILRQVAEAYDADHLLSLALSVAEDFLARENKRLIENRGCMALLNKELLLAAFYSVLGEILGVSLDDYMKTLTRLGIAIHTEKFIDLAKSPHFLSFKVIQKKYKPPKAILTIIPELLESYYND